MARTSTFETKAIRVEVRLDVIADFQTKARRMTLKFLLYFSRSLILWSLNDLHWNSTFEISVKNVEYTTYKGYYKIFVVPRYNYSYFKNM